MLNKKINSLVKMDFQITFDGLRSFHLCNEECYDDSDKSCLFNSSLQTNNYGTLCETMLFVENLVKNSNFIEVENDRCVPQIHDDEYFVATTVCLKDRLNRIIFSGIIDGKIIHWIKPIYDKISITKLNAQINQLQEEAAFEAGFDNYSTAESLRTHANNLGLALVDNRYVSMVAELINNPNIIIRFC